MSDYNKFSLYKYNFNKEKKEIIKNKRKKITYKG